MTDAARPILRGEAEIHLREDTIKSAQDGPTVRTMVSDEDAPLLSALKAKRRALAEAAGVPAYIVFTDKTLIEMAEKRPATLDDIAHITGVGAAKLDRYGLAFLQVINGAAPNAPHPVRRKLASGDDGALYDALEAAARALERGAAGADKLLTLSPGVLRDIATRKPATRDTLARIKGMDDARLDRFGAALLDVLQQH
jgi:ATP-dependent DNA helicase RecQ